MPTKPPTILAIDPGTKELGFAVLTDGHLSYYGVKTFKRRSPPHAFLTDLSGFIASLIARYKPDCLAIERTFLIQKSATLLNVTAVEIKQAAINQGLMVCEYAPSEVRNILCQRKKTLKREMVQVIAKRFPELARFLRQPTKWEALYWSHMFDAVAVGVVCLDEVYGASDQSGANP